LFVALTYVRQNIFLSFCGQTQNTKQQRPRKLFATLKLGLHSPTTLGQCGRFYVRCDMAVGAARGAPAYIVSPPIM